MAKQNNTTTFQRRLDHFPEGCKVRLKADIERYPHFIADAGSIGVVTENSEWLFTVKMDALIDGAQEWDNEICWADCSLDGQDLTDELDILPQ